MKEHPFEELASYSLPCLTTPMIFSRMTIVKVKQRKRVLVKMLKSLLTIPMYLHVGEKDDASITRMNVF